MENKKYCKFCGEIIDIDAIVCPKCGRALSNPQIASVQTNNNQGSKNFGNQNIPDWLASLIVIIVFVFIFLVGKNELNFSSKGKKQEEETPKYDTARVYNIGETLNCPNFDITVDSVQIKVKGTYIDSYNYVNDPEWIGVIVTVRNKNSETDRFYTSNFNLINSNGEVITPSIYFYKVWGVEKYDSPELVSGGSKTGFIDFTNTNQDNSNLILKVDCDTGWLEDDVAYKVNISQ